MLERSTVVRQSNLGEEVVDTSGDSHDKILIFSCRIVNSNMIVDDGLRVDNHAHLRLSNLTRMALILSIPYWLPLSLETS